MRYESASWGLTEAFLFLCTRRDDMLCEQGVTCNNKKRKKTQKKKKVPLYSALIKSHTSDLTFSAVSLVNRTHFYNVSLYLDCMEKQD
uniref:Uncharacterized protein n=1 Tax=Anguilla anguilla TaxID=7936 RepID=A0A0E9QJA1_ANGAN